MAAPLVPFPFRVGRSLHKIHLAELNPRQLSLKQSYYQQCGLSSTSHCFQTSRIDRLPGYNYGLPGKGKSRILMGQRLTVNASGEILFGLHPVYLALKANRRNKIHGLYIDEKCTKRSSGVLDNATLRQIYNLATGMKLPVKFVRKCDLDVLCGNRPHQGVCLDTDELASVSWNESIEPEWSSMDPTLWLFLHNIQDPMNFGAILRSSYYMGIDKVIVPRNNSCKLSPVVSKASSGAMEVVDLLRLPHDMTEKSFFQWWKSHDGMILGTHCSTNMDGDNIKRVALQNFTLTRPSLLILGNEGTGLGDDIVNLCDRQLFIQSRQTGYHKEIDSLNVSVATGILLHWLQLSHPNL